MDPAGLNRDESRKHRMEQRASGRRPLAVPARITWKDSRGTTRFANAVTRDVSDLGVFIEVLESSNIPLFRLVQFQVEREARNTDGLPAPLRSGKVLSAVYRVGSFQRSTGTPNGYGLRLLIEPRSRAASARPIETAAIA